MSKALSFFAFIMTALASQAIADAPNSSSKATQPFTGKITGVHVRMRTEADLESHVLAELNKGDLIVIKGEHGDFYVAEAPLPLKGYIFRSFVIDNTVEGQHVNIRLSPNRDAPIIGHLNTGDKIEGAICKENNKWMEISLPKDAKFYVAKEFVEYAGNPDLKTIVEKRKSTVEHLLETAQLFAQSEMRKSFSEVDITRLSQNYQTIISDYSDFPALAEKAQKELLNYKDTYLQRKVAYLETKTDSFHPSKDGYVAKAEEALSSTDRMKVWEPIEETFYLNWSAMHHAKTIDDFYLDQKHKATVLSGVVDAYFEPVKNKPGDFILKEKDVPIAYIYSTHINLEELVGKKVNLTVYARPNNHFAFPAYYVLDAE